MQCESTTSQVRTEFRKQPDGGRPPGTAVRPEHDIVFVGVAPALEEVEEEVARLDVDVPRISPAQPLRYTRVSVQFPTLTLLRH